MAEFPALPLFTDAYLADTRHLTTEEHGAYLLLMMEAWRRPNCNLPDDDTLLARLSGLPLNRWNEVKPIIMAFWIRDGRKKIWTQKRLAKERLYVAEKRRKARDSAATRWKEEKKDDANAVPSQSPHTPPHLTYPSDTPEEGVVQCNARDQTENPDPGDDLQPTHFPADPAMDQLYDDVLKAAGLARGRMIPSGWLPPAATLHIARWRTLGITEAEIIAGVRNSQARYTDPPTSPKAYDHIMRQIAAAKQQPALTIPAQKNGGSLAARSEQARSTAEREDRIRLAAIRGST